MKKIFLALLSALAIGLPTSNSHAMSELVAFAMEPLWPDTTQPGNVVRYGITAIGRDGQGFLGVTFSTDGLPEGTTVNFALDYARFTGRVPTNQISLMTVTCPVLTPTDTYAFTVTASARRESITITNQITLPLQNPNGGAIILAVDRLSETSLWLRGLGTMGRTYLIESTTDLARPNWTVLGPTTADGNGRFSFFPEINRDTPIRFFRAVWMPPSDAAAE